MNIYQKIWGLIEQEEYATEDACEEAVKIVRYLGLSDHPVLLTTDLRGVKMKWDYSDDRGLFTVEINPIWSGNGGCAGYDIDYEIGEHTKTKKEFRDDIWFRCRQKAGVRQ